MKDVTFAGDTQKVLVSTNVLDNGACRIVMYSADGSAMLPGAATLLHLRLAGEGNGDSAVTVFGMIVGAAFAHNFGLAGNADAMNEAKEIVVGGISTNGKIAVCLGIVIMLAVSLWNMPKRAAVNAAAVK